MVTSVKNISTSVIRYLDVELAQKSNGLQKFFIYMLIPSIPERLHDLIEHYKPMFPQYFDSNGNVIVDQLYSDTKQAMEKALQVEIGGVSFNSNDVDCLYRYIID